MHKKYDSGAVVVVALPIVMVEAGDTSVRVVHEVVFGCPFCRQVGLRSWGDFKLEMETAKSLREIA